MKVNSILSQQIQPVIALLPLGATYSKNQHLFWSPGTSFNLVSSSEKLMKSSETNCVLHLELMSLSRVPHLGGQVNDLFKEDVCPVSKQDKQWTPDR